MASSHYHQVRSRRRELRMKHVAGCACASLLLFACAGPTVIPKDLEDRVDLNVTFVQLKNDPSAFQGRLVVLGGTVLSATLLKEGTRIEILQLPLSDSHEPGIDLSTSEGRFLGFHQGFLDPATLPPGTPVTVVGEVTGGTSLPLGETTYAYPTVTVNKLTTWRKWIPRYWYPSYPYPYYYRPYRGPVVVLPPPHKAEKGQ